MLTKFATCFKCSSNSKLRLQVKMGEAVHWLPGFAEFCYLGKGYCPLCKSDPFSFQTEVQGFPLWEYMLAIYWSPSFLPCSPLPCPPISMWMKCMIRWPSKKKKIPETRSSCILETTKNPLSGSLMWICCRFWPFMGLLWGSLGAVSLSYSIKSVLAIATT